MAWGGKGRVFKCQVIEFDNERYIEEIRDQFPYKAISSSDITHVEVGQIIIVKVIDKSDMADSEVLVHQIINSTKTRKNRFVKMLDSWE